MATLLKITDQEIGFVVTDSMKNSTVL